jgi:hypothetical protein
MEIEDSVTSSTTIKEDDKACWGRGLHKLGDGDSNPVDGTSRIKIIEDAKEQS